MQMSRLPAALAALGVALFSACKKHEAPVVAHRPRPEVVSAIPTLARAVQLDTTGTEDAERVTWSVALPFDTVVAIYHKMLPGLGWLTQSDEGDSTQRSLYMTKDSFSVWMHFTKAGPESTQWTVVGSLTQGVPPGGKGLPGRR
jgi:hypothetical protein